MPAARRLRRLAALLTLVLGCSHVIQLWLQPLDSTVIYTALFGIVYLLVSLGLSGQGRFTLWLGLVVPALGSYAGYLRYHLVGPAPVTVAHIAASLLVVALCVTILYRTRHAIMD